MELRAYVNLSTRKAMAVEIPYLQLKVNLLVV
jgi:hypothetical protein